MKILVAFILFFTFTSVSFAFGPSNKLCWDDPKNPSITGYKVYLDTITNSTKVGIDVGMKPVLEGTQVCILLKNVPINSDGTYFVKVTAYNPSGESGKSNEISFPFILLTLDAIKNLSVQ